MKSFYAAFCAVVLTAVAISGCSDPAETTYRDYLDATARVRTYDGKAAVANFNLQTYDWVIRFKDGSEIVERFDSTGPGSIMTDSQGLWKSSPEQVHLYSGNEKAYCQNVCVQWDYYKNWECVQWDYDKDGYSYCAYYDYVYYDYCAVYGQDCDYYYPSRALTDIDRAHAEITYMYNGSLVTTPSEFYTTGDKAITQTATPTGENDKIVDTTWVQDDRFLTPFTAAGAPAGTTPDSTERKVSAKMHAPAVVVTLDKLTDAQRAVLESVRASWPTK